MQTVWTIMAENHTGIILYKFARIPISGLGEVVRSFPNMIQYKSVTPGAEVNFDRRGIIWTHLAKDF